jgi:hypothetical protein
MDEYQEVESVARCWRRRRAEPADRPERKRLRTRPAASSLVAPCRGRARASWARGRQRRVLMCSLRTAGCFRRGGGGLAEVAGVLAVRMHQPELFLQNYPVLDTIYKIPLIWIVIINCDPIIYIIHPGSDRDY